jgi:hypothetical protein
MNDSRASYPDLGDLLPCLEFCCFSQPPPAKLLCQNSPRSTNYTPIILPFDSVTTGLLKAPLNWHEELRFKLQQSEELVLFKFVTYLII